MTPLQNIAASILAATCVFHSVAADDTAKSSLDGTWLWNFTMPDGAQVTPRVKFKTKDGELTGTSRFRAGGEVPITNITFKNGELSFDVVRDLFGDQAVTRYSGKLEGTAIKGKITSSSGGEKHVYDWDAKRISGIDGVWKWSVTVGERTFDSRVTLKLDGERLTGKLSGGRGDVDIHRGRLRDNRVSFEVERRGFDGERTTNVYRGRLDGDKIAGIYTSTFGGLRTNDWNAVRAD